MRMRIISTCDGHMIFAKITRKIRPFIFWSRLRSRCKMSVGILITLVMVSGFTTVSSRNNGLSTISQCICSGYNVTYQCSISGLGSTIWKGTAFSSCLNNRIRLRHLQFLPLGGTTGTCNNGAIVGHSVGVQDITCYISQLDVFITSDIIGRTIICSYDNGSIEDEVASSTLTATTDPFPPPTTVMLTNASSTQLTFSWDAVGSNCAAIKYNILAENCGSCPATSNTTTAICINPQPEPNAGVICSFRVQTEVCEGVVGGASNSSIVKLKVPDIPVITVVPTYLQSERTLTSISVRIMETASFIISNGINGSSTSYNITYTNSTSGDFCNSDVILASSNSCTNSVCNSVFDDISSHCPSTGLSVTVFATNILGYGEASDPFIVDKSNNFVNLSYDTTTKSVTCAFINKEDVSEKSCSIVYGVCEQQQVRTVQRNFTGNSITLMLDDLREVTYCYIAIASNSTFAVNIINGKINLSNSFPQENTGAIVGGVIGAFIIIITFAGIGVFLLYFYLRRVDQRSNVADDDNTDYSDELIPVKKRRFKRLKVGEDCELAQFIQQQKLIFQKGRVFYEFTRDEEDINAEKEVILMDKKTKMLYTGKKACTMIRAPGRRIPNPKLEDYDVYVQSMGIGCRPLEADSHILYDLERKRSQPSHQKKELLPVDPNRFIRVPVDQGGELIEILEKQDLKFKPGCAFFEFMNEQENIDENKEVILLDTVNDKMYTGPAALEAIGAPDREIDRPVLSNKRVFVQSLFKGSRYIHGNTLLLYEEPASDHETLEKVEHGRFKQYNVHKDYGLRFFVEKVCHLKYDARRFFFEFVSRELEITDDKEIILMKKDSQSEDPEIFTGLKAKEMIGAPSKVVNMPTLDQYRVFVQNGGAGTQCLKAGTILLYEVKYKF